MNWSKAINLSMPVFFICFSIYVIASTFPMGKAEGTFPYMIGVFTLIVGVFQLFFDLVEKEHADKFKGSNILKVIEFLGVLSCYIFLFKKIGYIADTTLLAFYAMYSLGYKNIKVAVPLAALISCVAYFVFSVFLAVPLPAFFAE